MLLDHNQKTFIELEKFIQEEKHCCVVNPCGSGKTSIMSEVIKAHPDKKIIIFTRQKNAKTYYQEKDDMFKNIHIYTYRKLQLDSQTLDYEKYQADIYMLDEAHYIGAEKISEVLKTLIKLYNPLLIGFTATPQRFDQQGSDETIVTTFFDGNSAGNYTVRDLQNAGVFIEPEYVLSLWNLNNEIESRLNMIEESDLKENEKIKWRNHLQNILKQWQKESSPYVVFETKLPKYMYKDKCNRILVYTASFEDMQLYRKQVDAIIKNIFKKEVKSYEYSYRSSEKELQEFLKEDSAYIKILYSIDKIMETIHIDDLNIAFMMRPSVSNRIITQQFGRLNSIGNTKKPLIIDMVGNLNKLDSFVNTCSTKRLERTEKTHHYRPQFAVEYIAKYTHIFEKIDSAFVSTKNYTYNGYTGSLYQIAKIHDVSHEDLKRLVIHDCYDIEDALKELPKLTKSRITSEILNGYEDFPAFTLSQNQKQCIDKYMPLIQRYIERKKIKDEDMIQNLYLGIMYFISTVDSNKDITTAILNKLNTLHVTFMKHNHLQKQLYTKSYDEPVTNEADGYENIIAQIRNKELDDVLQNLTERERKIMQMRFGFDTDDIDHEYALDEIAKHFNVTVERIRQIQNKAINKIIRYSRKPKTILREYIRDNTRYVVFW